ncbi:MAG TPA: N-acetylneuraminate synthase family protein [Nitratidesulfovibrio sp.]|nr:N-acetylneuraminate synthase family protein [Nitratidesulfovibrio sp.]
MTYFKNLQDFGYRQSKDVYVIAEIGLNHGGDVECGKRLIESAVRAGVDAVKFQTYLTEKRAPAGNTAMAELLKKLELPFAAFAELKQCAGNLGVDFFSTAFDTESVDFLESIECSMYKIASFDVVNMELLRAVAATNKPVIMSVGMSSLEEIRSAYGALRDGTDKITLLHCISAYPLEESDAELAAVPRLRAEFDCLVGYSDHTPDIRVPLYAVAAGAQVIEKHYKMDEAFQCVDAPVSITEAQMAKMVNEIRLLEKMFGQGEFGVRKVERGTTVFRRPSA